MPFTLAHTVAALPFRRARFVPSALVMGTIAPDIEYFIRLAPGGGWGHTLPGAFCLSLPLGLGALWLFHRFVKVPLAHLLPDSVRARLTPYLGPFQFGPLRRFLLIVAALLLGIATHLVWDGFTHQQYWLTVHTPILQRFIRVPVLGIIQYWYILQMISTFGGLAVLAWWCRWWYRRTPPDPSTLPNPFSARHRVAVIAAGITVAVIGAFARAWIGEGVPHGVESFNRFVNDIVVTFGALLWWQTAFWGIIGPFRHSEVAEAADLVKLSSHTR